MSKSSFVALVIILINMDSMDKKFIMTIMNFIYEFH